MEKAQRIGFADGVQADFIDRMTAHTEAFWARTGSAPLYHIITYGCQMNANDSEKLAGILQRIGYEPADDAADANLLLFNTCCVREHAEDRLIGKIGVLRKWRAADPGRLLGVCGCMSQQDGVAERLARTFAHIDFIAGTHDMLSRLPQILWEASQSENCRIYTDERMEVVESVPVAPHHAYSYYVSIMYGCDNFCTYCIVPYVRGRERSRRPEDILAEIEGYVANGCREVTLLGQNVNSYAADGAGAVSFPQLLRRVNAIDGLRRIRFMTSHPKDLSEELIAAMAESDKVCRHIHLPVQSGSDAILAAMNRRYTAEQYLQKVAQLRSAMPDLSISTDVIVGFPGETEADFEQSLALYRAVGFDFAFCFKYSPRGGTPAADMPGQVGEAEKKERLARLLAVQDEVANAKNQVYVGRTVEILTEARENGRNAEREGKGFVCQGRTEGGILTSVSSAEPIGEGQFIKATIDRANAHVLYGSKHR